MRDSEVDQNRSPVAHDDVRGLDVAMHDAVNLQDSQGLRQASRELPPALGRQRPPQGDRVAQVRPSDVLGRQPCGGSRDVRVEETADVRVVHAAQHLGLPLEAGGDVRVVEKARPDNLHRSHIISVPGAVDDTHTT